MQAESLKDTSAAVVTPARVAAYLQYEQERGASEDALRNCKRVMQSLLDFLPEDKTVTKEQLLSWRQGLKEHGYSSHTELRYVKGINRYLDYAGLSELRFQRGKAKNIAGHQFGYLTAVEPTGEKDRKNLVWRCRCRCGKEAEYSASRLLAGNVISCGCLKGEHFKRINKYIDGTSLRQSLEEAVVSTRAESGYTGVTKKRGKWQAYIKYKRQQISLGSYSSLEDAVKARARGKELVQMDALGLLDLYEQLHKADPEQPERRAVRVESPEADRREAHTVRAIRSNNTSGCPGVSRKRNKWAAKITLEKITYQLGTFADLDAAVAARREAERLWNADPQGFREKYQNGK